MDSPASSVDRRTPTFWTSSMTDYDLENMSEIERLRYVNNKLKHENEILKLDCESYINLMNVERDKNLKKYRQLEQKITHLSEVVETQGQSKELVELLNKNIEVILVSERELKIIYEVQQEIADRVLNVYRYMSSLSRRVRNKMDEIRIEISMENSAHPVDDEVVQEKSSRDESKIENEMINEDLEMEESKNDDSERMDFVREDGHPKKEVHFVDEESALYEERFKNYQMEIDTLKNIVKKLTKDKEDVSFVSSKVDHEFVSSKDDNGKDFVKSDNTQVSSRTENEKVSKDNDGFISSKGDDGSVAALTSRLIMARLALGELDPTEAYKILQESNALGSYTMADLKIIASSSSKKKKNPMKKLKRIFSIKKTAPVEPRQGSKSTAKGEEN